MAESTFRPPIPRPVLSFDPLVAFSPVNTSDDAVFALWCRQPTHNERTLEEFAEDGGKPIGPRNRSSRFTESTGPR